MTARKPSPPEPGFHISPSALKWIVGFIGALLGAIILWWQVWDRIDSHWRLETTQKALDDKTAAELKAVRDREDGELAAHKNADARSQAWTLFAIQDFRAAAEQKWAEDCAKEKRPADVCRELDRRAADSRKQASDMRAAALDASKEKP